MALHSDDAQAALVGAACALNEISSRRHVTEGDDWKELLAAVKEVNNAVALLTRLRHTPPEADPVSEEENGIYLHR